MVLTADDKCLQKLIMSVDEFCQFVLDSERCGLEFNENVKAFVDANSLKQTKSSGTVESSQPAVDMGDDGVSPPPLPALLPGPPDSPVLSQTSNLGDTELDQLVNVSRPDNTMKNTKWGVSRFTQWCTKRNISVDFHTITPETLVPILRKFFAEVKSTGGRPLTPSSLT